MPEFKPTDVIKLQNLESTEGIKSTVEILEVKEKIEEPQNVPSPKDLYAKKLTSLTKRLDNLNNIEKVRKELGLTELGKETTDIITRQKIKIQEDLTGMEQQTTETQNDQGNLEKNTTYSVEDDPRFRKMLEEEAYFRLKTYDREYFNSMYSGLSEDGYLIDLDGKKTMSMPSMNIGGKTGDLKYSEFIDITKQKFLHKHPDAQEKENTRINSERNKEKLKIYDNPDDDPEYRKVLERIAYQDKLDKIMGRESTYSHSDHEFNLFKNQFPEKAVAYLKDKPKEEEPKIINSESQEEIPNENLQVPQEEVKMPDNNVDEVSNSIILEPNEDKFQTIEKKEAIPFDTKKVYGALENMLIVFDARARKLGRFDIMPQKAFDKFAHLYEFMSEKIMGKEQTKDSGQIVFDIESDLNKELLEKFKDALDSLEITPTQEWQGLNSQQEYLEDLNKMRDSMGYMVQELAPFAKALEDSKPYKDSGGFIKNSIDKVYSLQNLFGEKANSYEQYMRA